jgi:MFS family permease
MSQLHSVPCILPTFIIIFTHNISLFRVANSVIFQAIIPGYTSPVPTGRDSHDLRGAMSKPKLWTKDFILLTLVNIFIALNLYLLIVSISQYAMEKFHSSPSQAGLATGIFMLGILFARLFTGKWIERIGRARTFKTGLVLSLITSSLYFAVGSIGSLLVVRFLHGAALGIASTGVSTIAADTIPKQRKGEGLAYYMLGVTLATAIGPFLAMFFSRHGSFTMIFAACCTSAALSLVIALFVSIPEISLTAEQLEGTKGFNVRSFLEPKAFPIAIVCGIIYFCYSSVLSFLAAYAREVQLMDAAGLFFVVYAASVLLSRPYSGRLFDSKGENTVMYPAIAAFVIGMFVLAQAHHGYMLLVSAALIGVGSSAVQSLSQAISIRVTEPHRIGLATSTFFVSMDMTIGIGPFIFGLFVPLIGYRGIYVGGGMTALACMLLYYMLHGRKAVLPHPLEPLP